MAGVVIAVLRMRGPGTDVRIVGWMVRVGVPVRIPAPTRDGSSAGPVVRVSIRHPTVDDVDLDVVVEPDDGFGLPGSSPESRLEASRSMGRHLVIVRTQLLAKLERLQSLQET
jgi:hypothetical protein